MILNQVRVGLISFISLLQGALVFYCVLGWFMDPHNPILRFLARVTEPILHPIRQAMSRNPRSASWSGFTPLIAVLILQILSGFLMSL